MALKPPAPANRSGQIIPAFDPETGEDFGLSLGDAAKSIGADVVDSVGYTVKGAAMPLVNLTNKVVQTATGESPRYEAKNLAAPVSKAMRDSISGAGQRELQQNQIKGDLLKPSTWSLGENPTVAGVGTQALGAVAQAAPTLGLALATRKSKLAMPIMGGYGAAQSAGAAAGDEAERLNTMKPDQLGALPRYQELIKSGMTPQAAKEQLSIEVQNSAGGAAAISGGAEGLILPALVGGRLKVPSMGGKSLAGRMAGGYVTEGAQEASEKVLQNIGASAATGEQRSITDDTLGDFALGGFAGAGFGAIHGNNQAAAPLNQPAAKTPAAPAGADPLANEDVPDADLTGFKHYQDFLNKQNAASAASVDTAQQAANVGLAPDEFALMHKVLAGGSDVGVLTSAAGEALRQRAAAYHAGQPAPLAQAMGATPEATASQGVQQADPSEFDNYADPSAADSIYSQQYNEQAPSFAEDDAADPAYNEDMARQAYEAQAAQHEDAKAFAQHFGQANTTATPADVEHATLAHVAAQYDAPAVLKILEDKTADRATETELFRRVLAANNYNTEILKNAANASQANRQAASPNSNSDTSRTAEQQPNPSQQRGNSQPVTPVYESTVNAEQRPNGDSGNQGVNDAPQTQPTALPYQDGAGMQTGNENSPLAQTQQAPETPDQVQNQANAAGIQTANSVVQQGLKAPTAPKRGQREILAETKALYQQELETIARRDREGDAYTDYSIDRERITAQKRALNDEFNALNQPASTATPPATEPAPPRPPVQPNPVAYEHKPSGMTWTGRGRKPQWVQDFIAEGGDLETLRVDTAKPSTAAPASFDIESKPSDIESESLANIKFEPVVQPQEPAKPKVKPANKAEYLATSTAARWLKAKLGDKAMNDSNLYGVAQFLNGDKESFDGILTANASDRLFKSGYRQRSTGEIMAKLKEDFTEHQHTAKMKADMSNDAAVPETKPARPARPIREYSYESPTVPDEAPANEPAPAGYGDNNKGIKKDQYEKIKEEMRKRAGRMNSGVDPELLSMGIQMAMYHLEASARSFADFATTIAADIGWSKEEMKPYIRGWYNGARDTLEDSNISIDGLDDAGTVGAAYKAWLAESAESAEDAKKAEDAKYEAQWAAESKAIRDESAAKFAIENPAAGIERLTTAEPVAEVAHIEDGDKEPVTPAVVNESLNKAYGIDVETMGKLDPAKARRWLEAQIDNAITKLTTKGGIDPAMRDLQNDYAGYMAQKSYSKSDDEIKKLDKNLAEVRQKIGYVTFDVKGDGKFKVLNTVNSLEEFKKRVLASSGFKKPTQKRAPTAPDMPTNTTASTINEMAETKGEGLAALELDRMTGTNSIAFWTDSKEFRPDQPMMMYGGYHFEVLGRDFYVGKISAANTPAFYDIKTQDAAGNDLPPRFHVIDIATGLAGLGGSYPSAKKAIEATKTGLTPEKYEKARAPLLKKAEEAKEKGMTQEALEAAYRRMAEREQDQFEDKAQATQRDIDRNDPNRQSKEQAALKAKLAQVRISDSGAVKFTVSTQATLINGVGTMPDGRALEFGLFQTAPDVFIASQTATDPVTKKPVKIGQSKAVSLQEAVDWAAGGGVYGEEMDKAEQKADSDKEKADLADSAKPKPQKKAKTYTPENVAGALYLPRVALWSSSESHKQEVRTVESLIKLGINKTTAKGIYASAQTINARVANGRLTFVRPNELVNAARSYGLIEVVAPESNAKVTLNAGQQTYADKGEAGLAGEALPSVQKTMLALRDTVKNIPNSNDGFYQWHYIGDGWKVHAIKDNGAVKVDIEEVGSLANKQRFGRFLNADGTITTAQTGRYSQDEPAIHAAEAWLDKIAQKGEYPDLTEENAEREKAYMAQSKAFAAEKAAEVAKAQNAEPTANAENAEPIATYSTEVHTKNGKTLHLVQTQRAERSVYDERLSLAIEMGGYYSTYSKAFTFKTEEAAKAFQAAINGGEVPASATPANATPEQLEQARQEREAAATKKRTDKLRVTANKLLADANNELNRERQTNTNKRAQQARSSIEQAYRDEALAKTILRLADAIDSGEAVELANVSSKAQVVELSREIRMTKIRWVNAEEKRKSDENGFKYYFNESQRQEVDHAPLTQAMADIAKIPDYTAHSDNVRRLVVILRDTTGTKALGDKIARYINQDHHLSTVPVELAEQVISKLGTNDRVKSYIPDAWYTTSDHLRLFDKLGITTDEQLSRALMELTGYQAAKGVIDKAKSLEMALAGNSKVGIEFFPTPPALAARMVELARVGAGQKVLEPSAGTGNIATVLKNAGADVFVVEKSSTLREILTAKNFNLVGHDFMDVADGGYAAVVMNPPFGEDAEHIQHAYDLLADGGVLVAIVGEGTMYRQAKRDVAFREWLEERNAEVEKLPDNTFMDKSQLNTTGAAARLIVIEKPAASAESTSNTVNVVGELPDVNDSNAESTETTENTLYAVPTQNVENADTDNNRKVFLSALSQLGKYEAATKTLSLRGVTIQFATPNAGEVAIFDFKSRIQGAKQGERLLQMVTQLADTHQIKLTLSATPLDANNNVITDPAAINRLRAFYGRNGFVAKAGTSTFMERPPIDKPVVTTKKAEKESSLVSAGTQAPKTNVGGVPIQDAGENLYYNRKNPWRSGVGVKWADISDRPDALKRLEVKKAKIWPEPKWQSLIDAAPEDFKGITTVFARLVKTVYNAVAVEPAKFDDASLQTYIGALDRLRAAAEAAMGSRETMIKFVSALANSKSINNRQSFAVMEMLTTDEQKKGLQPLRLALFPDTEINSAPTSEADKTVLRVLGGRKFWDSIQWNQYDIVDAVKQVAAGWPTPQKQWQKQGYAVLPLAENVDANVMAMRNDVFKPRVTLRGNNTTYTVFYSDQTYKSVAEAQAAADIELEKFKALGDFALVHKYKYISSFPNQEAAEVGAAAQVSRKKSPQEVAANAKPTASGMWSREGAPRRQTGENISSQQLMDVFGFRGVNFGKYVKDAERQDHLNGAYDSLMDMAELLNVPPDALSLGGMLGLGFGAQGNGNAGGKTAAGHFVAGVNEINITKDGGYGVLAHEFAHALDHYFGVQAGMAKQLHPYLSYRNDRTYNNYDPSTLRPEIQRAFEQINSAIRDTIQTAAEQIEADKDALPNAKATLAAKIEKLIDSRPERLEKINADPLAKNALYLVRNGEIGEYVMWKAPRAKKWQSHPANIKAIADALGWDNDGYDAYHLKSAAYSVQYARDRRAAQDYKDRTVQSELLKASQHLDGKKDPYWATHWELFARSFEAYIYDKLAERGQSNDYLVFDHPDSGAIDPDWPYPSGEARAAINQAYESLISEIRVKQDENGKNIMYRKAGQGDRTRQPFPHFAKGMQAETLDKMVRAIAANWKNAPIFRVVQSSYEVKGVDLPEDAEGAYSDGVVYLVADNLPNAAHASFVLLHETLGHAGLEGVFGSRLKPLMNHIYRTNDEIRSAARVLMKQYNYDVATATEEVLADMAAQESETPSVIARVIAAMKQILRAIMGKRAITDDVQIKNLLANARKNIIHGDPTRPQGGLGTKFSMAGQRSFDPAEIYAKAKDAASDLIRSDRTFNLWWDTTVGTQFHKASKDSHFRKVYLAVQKYLQDTAYFAIRAEQEAPFWLGGEGGFKGLKNDYAKLKNSFTDEAKDRRERVKDAIISSTLRDSREYDPAELKTRFGLDQEGVEQYAQFRNAVGRSIDDLGKASLYHLLRSANLDPSMMGSLRTTNLSLTEAIEPMLEQLKTAREMTIEAILNQAGKKKVSQLNQTDNARLNVQLTNIDDTVMRIKQVGERAQLLKDQGYAPLMRFGNYTLTVYDENGNPENFQIFETQAQSNAAMREAERKPDYADMRLEQGVLSHESYKEFSGLTPESVELFADMMGIEQNEAMQQFYRMAVSNRSAMKRMIERKGIAGYSEDMERVLAAFVTSNARRISAQYHSGEIGHAVDKIPKQKGDVKDEAQKLVDYVIEPKEEAAGLRNFMFLHYMGASVASAVVNLTQPYTMTLPYLSQWGVGTAATTLAKASIDATTEKNLSSDEVIALTRARTEGHTEPHEIHQMTAQASGSIGSHHAMRLLTKAAGSLFALAESANRKITFLAAYRTAKANPNEIADAYGFACRAIAETQGVYNKGNRANWGRGAVGATLMTFKQFSVAYLELYVRLGKDNHHKQYGIGAAKMNLPQAVMMLALMSLAGLEGLPFYDDVSDVIDTIGNRLGYKTNSRADVATAVSDVLGETLGKLMMRGSSSVTPFDVAGRTGVGNLLPMTAFFNPTLTTSDRNQQLSDFFGAAGGLVNSAGQALRGNVMALAPKAVRDAVAGTEMAVTGVARDTGGRKVIDTTTTDAIVKGLGFQPSKVAEVQRQTGYIRRDVNAVNAFKARINADFANAVIEDDQEARANVLAELQEWNQTNPEAKVTLNLAQIRQRVKQAQMTKAQRVAKTAPKEIRADVMKSLSDL